ncbi:MAG: AraC family transcriptional regulator [Prevotella sp.]|nr:AraC family transcriptional regulator [Prevotella sp.]
MSKQPQLMDLSRMRDIFTPHLSKMSENIFFNGEIGIVHSDPTVFRLLMRQKPPFSINDHRFGIIVHGEAHVNFNLQDRHVTAGTLVYLGPGTIITPIRFSHDLKLCGIGLFADFPMPFAQGQMPSAFNGQVRDFQLPVGEDDISTALHIFDTIWQVTHCDNYHRPTVTALVAALMHYYDHLFRQQTDRQAVSRSREQTIFDRFIQLAGQHCAEHHQIGYYAERLCLTDRYLSTVVRQTSGTTAKDWIDRALITRIKIELRHTDKPAAQIAEEMHFANPSFFSKYFRRLTGMTPLAYKNMC